MNISKLLIYRLFIFIVFIGAVVALISGGEWLNFRIMILFGFHLGTVIAWLGLTFCSLLAISINRNNPRLRFISSISFYLSIFWLLISYLLAGNNNLFFSDSRQLAFNIWMFICLAPIIILVASFIFNILSMILKRPK